MSKAAYKCPSSSLNFISKKERMSNRAKIVAIPKTTTTTTTFLPTSVATCALWLDAADPAGNGVVPANGATVTTWADKSGNSANGTAAGGAITYNSSANGLTFNGSYFSLPNNTISPGAANYTIFCVVKPTIISNYPYLWFAGTGGPAGQAMSLVFYPTGEVENGFWTDFMGIAPAGTVAINNTYMFSSAYNGAIVGRVLYKNGTSVVSGTPTTTKNTQASSSVSIGGSSVLTGIYHELIVFNSFLGTTNRQTVEAYLAQKWGLTASLPAGHPGLTTSVYIQTVTLAVPIQKIRTIPRAGAAVNFLPTSITGCSLWLDGADATTLTQGGGTVSQWSDKSGNARHITQATTGNQPTYSSTSKAVIFTGTQYLNIPSALAAITPVYTIFVVERRASANVMFFIGGYGVGSGNTALIIGYNGTTVSHHTTASISDCQVTVPTYAGASEPTRINRYDYTGSTRDTFINGGSLSTTQSFSQTLPTWSSANVGIGFGTTYGYIGNIYEIIFYNATLTNTQQQTVESYLAQKWGLTASLPTGHPGLTTTVYGTVAAAPTVRQKIRILPPPAPLVSYTQAFAYTGANQIFAVPATTTSITVYMWGAGGGGGHTGTQGATAGGAGAYVQGILTVSPNSSIRIIVGGGGAHGSVGAAYGGGGSANAAGTYGGGGGRSAIQVSGTEMVDAGGGGGAGYDSSGGYANFSPTINGGAGYPGSTGASWPFDSGAGGTQTAGGAGGPGNASSYGVASPGTYLAGGSAAPYAGGGGSGYYGGGGGNTNDTNGAGGGGGSSYTTNPAFTLIAGSNSPNSGNSAPASGSSYYISGVASGSTNMTSGGNGCVVFVYMA